MGNLDVETDTRRGKTMWRDTKGKQLSTSQGERSEINPSLRAFKRNQSCWHLDFRLLASSIHVEMGLSLQSSRGNTAWKVRLWFFLFWDPLKFTQGFHWSFCHLSTSVVNITGPETKVQDQVRSATPQLKADRSTKGIQIQYLSDAWRVHKPFCSALGGGKVGQVENPE